MSVGPRISRTHLSTITTTTAFIQLLSTCAKQGRSHSKTSQDKTGFRVLLDEKVKSRSAASTARSVSTASENPCRPPARVPSPLSIQSSICDSVGNSIAHCRYPSWRWPTCLTALTIELIHSTNAASFTPQTLPALETPNPYFPSSQPHSVLPNSLLPLDFDFSLSTPFVESIPFWRRQLIHIHHNMGCVH